MRSLMICTPTQYCSGDQIQKNEVGVSCSTWGRAEVYTGFWWRNLRYRDYLEDPGIDGKIILRWIIRKCDVRTWTGLIWPRIGTVGGHL